MYNNIQGRAISQELQVLDHFETTYNFEVEDNHNYYVSEECILVHNDCIKNEFDPIENADEVVKYYSNESVNDAFHQNSGVHKDKYIAKDLTTHGHSGKSRYKLLKK